MFEIDNNYAVPAGSGEDLVYLSADEAPFRVYGLEKPVGLCYNRSAVNNEQTGDCGGCFRIGKRRGKPEEYYGERDTGAHGRRG